MNNEKENKEIAKLWYFFSCFSELQNTQKAILYNVEKKIC